MDGTKLYMKGKATGNCLPILDLVRYMNFLILPISMSNARILFNAIFAFDHRVGHASAFSPAR